MAKKTEKSPPDAVPLREQAEARWRTQHSDQAPAAPRHPAKEGAAERIIGKPAAASERDIAGTIYELEVHQIELELQNEELRRAHGELAEVRDDYQALYDFAPVGYLTLDVRRIVRQ